jgi:hypothetical protein
MHPFKTTGANAVDDGLKSGRHWFMFILTTSLKAGVSEDSFPKVVSYDVRWNTMG